MKNKKNPETFGSRWRYVWVLFALVFSVSVAAQKTVVKGNILDKDNLPIIGANILEKGTSNGTISDVDGNFTLSITNPKATLLIRPFLSEIFLPLCGWNSVRNLLYVYLSVAERRRLRHHPLLGNARCQLLYSGRINPEYGR